MVVIKDRVERQGQVSGGAVVEDAAAMTGTALVVVVAGNGQFAASSKTHLPLLERPLQ